MKFCLDCILAFPGNAFTDCERLVVAGKRLEQESLRMKTDEIGAVEPELVMTASELSVYVRSVFPQAESYGWSVDDLQPAAITVSMQASGENLRPGGTVSGPTMFALADITAYLLVLAHIGEVALAVTTNLSINFLSKPKPGALIGQGRLLKLGKRLAVCEIHIHSAGSETVIAQATATYSIPPDRPAGMDN